MPLKDTPWGNMRQARSATHTPGNVPRPPRPSYLPPPPPPSFAPPPPPPSFAPPPPPKCSNSPLPAVIGNSETVVYEQVKPVNGANSSQHELTSHSDDATNDLTNSITTEDINDSENDAEEEDYDSEGEAEAEEETNGVEECFYEEVLELTLEKKPQPPCNIVEEEVLEVILPIKIEEVCTEDGSEESSSYLSDSEDDSSTSSEVQPSVNIVEVTDLKECEGLATVDECTVNEVDEDEEDVGAEELEEDVVQPSYIDEPEDPEEGPSVQDEVIEEVTNNEEVPFVEEDVKEDPVEVVKEDNECDLSINKDDDVLEVKGDIREEASASSLAEEQNVEHEKVQEDTQRKEFLKSIPIPKIPPFVKSEPPCDFREDPSTWIEWLEGEVNKYKQEQAEKKRVKEQELQGEQGQVPTEAEEVTENDAKEEQEEEGQQKSFVVSDEHQGQVDNSVVKEDQDLEKSETQNELAQDALNDQRGDQDEAENNEEEGEDWEWEDEDNENDVNEVENKEKQEMPIEITSESSPRQQNNEQEDKNETDLESEINHEVVSIPEEKDEAKEQEENNGEDWEWEDEEQEEVKVEEKESEIITDSSESTKDETEVESKDEAAEETDNFATEDKTELSRQQSIQHRKHRVVKSTERESDPMEVIEKMRQMRQNRVLQRHVSADGNSPNSTAPAPPPFMRMHSNPAERSSRPSSICTEDNLDDMLGRVKKLREERQQILKDMARLKDAYEETDNSPPKNGVSPSDHQETTRRSSFDSGIGPSKSVTTEGSVASETTTIQTRKISHQSSENDSNIIYCFICDEELGTKLTKGNIMHMGLEDGEPICPEAFNLTEKSKEKIKNIALTQHLDLRAKYEFLETLDLDLLAGDDYELTSEDVLQKVESFLDNVEEQKKKDQEQFDLLRTGAINEIFAEEFFASSSLATSDYTEDFNAFQEDDEDHTDQATSPLSETETIDEPHDSIQLAPPAPPAPPGPPPPPPPVLLKPDDHLKEARSDLLNSIKSGGPKLKTAITDDKSQVSEAGKVLHKHLAPRVFTKEVRDLMHEIQNHPSKTKLKKTKTIDRSKPYIPQDIEIFFYAGPNSDHKKLAPPPKSREIPNHKSPSPEPPKSSSLG